jgi:hypothetical protein
MQMCRHAANDERTPKMEKLGFSIFEARAIAVAKRFGHASARLQPCPALSLFPANQECPH